MEKISDFTTTPRIARWMRIAFIVIVVIDLYLQFGLGVINQIQGDALGMLLYPVLKSFPVTFTVYLLDLVALCFLYELLRRQVKVVSPAANVACWMLIITKCANILLNAALHFLNDYTAVVDDRCFERSHALYMVNAAFSTICFAAIVWLCVLLMLRFTGRVKTLGIVWLVTVLIPEVLASLLAFIPRGSEETWNIAMNLYEIIVFLCAVLSPFFILYAFQKTQLLQQTVKDYLKQYFK